LGLLNGRYSQFFPIDGAPYDIREELSAYLQEVESRYPILTAPVSIA
jgi:hypothetical protein